MDNNYIEDLESAFIDLLDGNGRDEIRSFTGLSEKRCKEIDKLFSKVLYNYKKRHSIGDYNDSKS